ncbi:MAG: LD-carboxypeptidase [Verrucomicrobiales bacterium]|nr:LD-carboxypeptidase [Verrucomicrobiales bacterium]
MSFPLPRSVSEGSTLAIVAPAGPFDEEAFRKGVEWLELRYNLTFSSDIFSKSGYLAGTDERRLCELSGAINDDKVDAILCARGGFGTTRLLPGIELSEIQSANKMIVGFSDISALHARWAAAGVRSMHAPMVAALGSSSPPIRERWTDCLESPGETRLHRLEQLNGTSETDAEGRLCGGNLAVLCALNGTPYAPLLDDAIFFIEDVGERPYRIDRMLTTLRQSGWFDRIRGLIIGTFTEGDPGPDEVSLDDVLTGHFGKSPFPVLRGLSSGHIKENEPLVFGSTARITGGTLEIF